MVWPGNLMGLTPAAVEALGRDSAKLLRALASKAPKPRQQATPEGKADRLEGAPVQQDQPGHFGRVRWGTLHDDAPPPAPPPPEASRRGGKRRTPR